MTTFASPAKIDLREGQLPDALVRRADGRRAIETKLTYLQVYDVPLELVSFSADNHNKQSEKVFKAECESLALHGFIDPCLVRPFDEEDLQEFARLDPSGGDWSQHVEMIDGEHRSRAIAQWIQNGLPEGAHESLHYLVRERVVPCYRVAMSKEWAAHLRIILSVGHGDPDFAKLGKVLERLDKSLGGIEKLRFGLPWDTEHLQEIVAAGQFDWDKYKAGLDRTRSDNAGGDALLKITIEVPKGARDSIVTDVRTLTERHGGKYKVKG